MPTRDSRVDSFIRFVMSLSFLELVDDVKRIVEARVRLLLGEESERVRSAVYIGGDDE